MYNKLSLLTLMISVCLYACDHKTKNGNNANDATYAPQPEFHSFYQNNILQVTCNDSLNYTVKISCGHIVERVLTLSDSLVVDIHALIHQSVNFSDTTDDKFLLSYKLLNNDYKLPINISIDSLYNQTFDYVYHKKVENVEKTFAKLTSGDALRVFKRTEVRIDKADVKKWLYMNDLYLDDSQVASLCNIIADFSYRDSNVYIYEQDKHLPVMQNLQHKYYNIQTNMKADYYYLFATDKEDDVKEFVADVISQDFINAESNTNKSFSCFRPKYKDGLLPILLLGIDKQWNIQVIPIGLIYIDNTAPQITNDNVSRRDRFPDIPTFNKNNNKNKTFDSKAIFDNTKSDYISFPKYDFSIKANVATPKQGSLYVSTGQFYGNNVNFNFQFSGDVDKVIIKFGRAQQEVSLSGKMSPYTYNCWLPLNLGINNVTIIAKDKYGNERKDLYKIEMVRIKDGTPEINIDNNIEIYN